MNRLEIHSWGPLFNSFYQTDSHGLPQRTSIRVASKSKRMPFPAHPTEMVCQSFRKEMAKRPGWPTTRRKDWRTGRFPGGPYPSRALRQIRACPSTNLALRAMHPDLSFAPSPKSPPKSLAEMRADAHCEAEQVLLHSVGSSSSPVFLFGPPFCMVRDAPAEFYLAETIAPRCRSRRAASPGHQVAITRCPRNHGLVIPFT